MSEDKKLKLSVSIWDSEGKLISKEIGFITEQILDMREADYTITHSLTKLADKVVSETLKKHNGTKPRD